MKEKRLLLGDEAIALGAIHAGLSGVYAYPGTPSTEITEFIQGDKLARERGLHSRWCVNEKTAMETALGMSFMGKRALVCMKHVGLNVCADPFVNSGMTGVNGGVVVLVADDPSMHSSQDEQDSRFYGKFAMIPTFEPNNQQEAYDMMAYAFDYSERVCLPVLMRVTTRMAHSRAVVEVNTEAREENAINYNAEAKNWVLLPANARKRNDKVTAQQAELEKDAANSTYNIYMEGHNHKLGILASGIGFNYVCECFPEGCPYPILKVSQYPLPKKLVRRLLDECYAVACRHTADSRRVLAELRSTHRLALVSNFYGNLSCVLSEFRLNDLFECVVESASAGIRKPDPNIFLLCAAQLGVSPETAVVVGDSLANDICPASAAGFHTIWLRSPQWNSDAGGCCADIIIDHLDELICQ